MARRPVVMTLMGRAFGLGTPVASVPAMLLLLAELAHADPKCASVITRTAAVTTDGAEVLLVTSDSFEAALDDFDERAALVRLIPPGPATWVSPYPTTDYPGIPRGALGSQSSPFLIADDGKERVEKPVPNMVIVAGRAISVEIVADAVTISTSTPPGAGWHQTTRLKDIVHTSGVVSIDGVFVGTNLGGSDPPPAYAVLLVHIEYPEAGCDGTTDVYGAYPLEMP